MSTSKTGADWARKLTLFTDGIPKAGEVGALKAAEIVRVSVIEASGRYATSSLTKMSVRPIPPTAAEVRMTSPKAHLLDRDTKGHSILPGAVTNRRGRKIALSTPDGPRASATVRGTQGKRMWERGVAAALPKVEQIVSDSVMGAALRAFGL